MMKRHDGPYELIVIGGGPAGLAAAYRAWQSGLRKILIIERDRELGGILNQCIHSGFGLHYFKEELTGPEYAGRVAGLLRGTPIEVLLDTMALEVTPQREVHAVGKAIGYAVFSAGSVVLATGCRERTRGAVGTAGSRPPGILTAGTAQRYVNLEGCMPGRRAVILGSGDIGLIMARRMTLEGAKVLACVEIMPRSGGLTRNLVQCLHDYDIPLYLSHTVTEIRGRQRVEQAVVSRVDEDRRAIPGTEIVFDCDTVLFSVGLIPENELARAAGIEIDGGTGGPVVSGGTETSIPGIFACGNAVRVHDIVDSVTAEGERAGAAAARYARGNPSGPLPSGRADGPDSAGHKGGSLPAGDGGPETSLVCVVCPKGCLLKALKEDGDIRVTGQSCGRGEAYARDELTRPARVLTSTVKITGAPLRRCPVKTRSAIPKRLIFDAMRLLDAVELTSPVEEGTVVAGDIGGTGIPWVTTRDM